MPSSAHFEEDTIPKPGGLGSGAPSSGGPSSRCQAHIKGLSTSCQINRILTGSKKWAAETSTTS